MAGSNICCCSLLKVSESIVFSVESFILVVRESGDLSVAQGPRSEDASCSTSAHSVEGKASCGVAGTGGWAWEGSNGDLGNGNGG